MNASKFLAVAALATAFGGQAFAGSLAYNDGVTEAKGAQVSTLSRAEVQSQAGQYVNAPRGLAYTNSVSTGMSTTQSIRNRNDVRAEASSANRSNQSLFNATGA